LNKILYTIDDDWVYARSLMLENNAGTSLYIGMVPMNYLKLIDIPEYLLLDDIRTNQYKLYLATQDFKFKENNDLDFKKGMIIRFSLPSKKFRLKVYVVPGPKKFREYTLNFHQEFRVKFHLKFFYLLFFPWNFVIFFLIYNFPLYFKDNHGYP
jgi:hypothetical protein